jgi:hypothetical protein
MEKSLSLSTSTPAAPDEEEKKEEEGQAGGGGRGQSRERNPLNSQAGQPCGLGAADPRETAVFETTTEENGQGDVHTRVYMDALMGNVALPFEKHGRSVAHPTARIWILAKALRFSHHVYLESFRYKFD